MDEEDPFEVSGLAGDSAFEDSVVIPVLAAAPVVPAKPLDRGRFFGEIFFFFFFFFSSFFFFLAAQSSVLWTLLVQWIVPSAERQTHQIIVFGECVVWCCVFFF
jgi:hypothetical protein